MHYPNIKITLFKWISYRYDREMANKLLSWNKNFFTTTVFFYLFYNGYTDPNKPQCQRGTVLLVVWNYFSFQTHALNSERMSPKQVLVTVS